MFYRFFRKLYSLHERFKRKVMYSEFREKYDLADSFFFNGNYILFYGEGIIRIGSKSYIGHYSTVNAEVGCKVIIGDNCKLSHNVRIYTSTAVADQDFLKESLEIKKGDVIIGDGVWIGANVFINPGITIGENAVVGANSVVTRDIPPACVYGGVPARLIRKKNLKQ